MITQPASSDFDELLSLWETSVRSTHHFLTKEDILFYKPLIRNEYFKAVELYIIRNPHTEKIVAFMGLSHDNIEMLFTHPSEQAKAYRDWETDRKSTRLNSSHITRSRMPSSA